MRMRRECRERFPRHRIQRKPLVSNPGMLWCMSGSLTRGGWENVPGIPDAWATSNFTYLTRGPCCFLPREGIDLFAQELWRIIQIRIQKSTSLFAKWTMYLTHCGRDKMAAICKTTFSSTFSWAKIYKFHRSLFTRVQLTIFQRWFR